MNSSAFMFSPMSNTATSSCDREETLLVKAMNNYADTTSLDDHDVSAVLLDPGLHAEIAIKDPKALSYVRNRLRCVLALALGKGHIRESVGSQIYDSLYPIPPGSDGIEPNTILASKLANACLRLLTGRDRLGELKNGDASAYTDAFVDVRAGEALKSAVEGVIGRSIGIGTDGPGGGLAAATTGRCAFSEGSNSQVPPMDFGSRTISQSAASSNAFGDSQQAEGAMKLFNPLPTNTSTHIQQQQQQLHNLLQYEDKSSFTYDGNGADAWLAEDPCILLTFEAAILAGLKEFLSPPLQTSISSLPQTDVSAISIEDIHREQFRSEVEEDDASYALLDHLTSVAQSYLLVTQRVWSAYEAHHMRYAPDGEDSDESQSDDDDVADSGEGDLSRTLSAAGEPQTGTASEDGKSAISVSTTVKLRRVSRLLDKEKRAQRRNKPAPENALTRHMSWCCDLIDLILSSPYLVPPGMLGPLSASTSCGTSVSILSPPPSSALLAQDDAEWNPRLTSCISRLLFIVLTERRDMGEIMLRRMSSQAASIEACAAPLSGPLEFSENNEATFVGQGVAASRLGVATIITSHLLDHAITLHALQPPAFNFGSSSWASRVQHLVSVGIEGMLGGQIADNQRRWTHQKKVRFMRELLQKRFGDGLPAPPQPILGQCHHEARNAIHTTTDVLTTTTSSENVVGRGGDDSSIERQPTASSVTSSFVGQRTSTLDQNFVAGRYPILNMLLWRTVLGGGNLGAILEHCTSEEPYEEDWGEEGGAAPSSGIQSVLPGVDGPNREDQLDIDSDYGSSVDAPDDTSRTPTPSPSEGPVSPRADNPMSGTTPPPSSASVPRLSLGSSDNPPPQHPPATGNTPSYADYKRTQPLAAFSAWGTPAAAPSADDDADTAVPLASTIKSLTASVGITDLSPLIDPATGSCEADDTPAIVKDENELTCEDTAAFSTHLDEACSAAEGTGVTPLKLPPLPTGRSRHSAPFGSNSARGSRSIDIGAPKRNSSVKRRGSSSLTTGLDATRVPAPPTSGSGDESSIYIRPELVDLIQASGGTGSAKLRSSLNSLNRSARRFSIGRIDEVDEHGFMLTPREGGGIMITRDPSRSLTATPRDSNRSLTATPRGSNRSLTATPREYALDSRASSTLPQRRRSSINNNRLSPTPITADSPHLNQQASFAVNSFSITSPRGGLEGEDAFSPLMQSGLAGEAATKRSTSGDFFMPFGVAQVASFDVTQPEGLGEAEGFAFRASGGTADDDEEDDGDDDDMLGKNFRMVGNEGGFDDEDELDRALSGGDLEAARAEAMEGESERKVQLSVTGRSAIVDVVMGNMPQLLQCFLAADSVSALARTNQRCAIIGLLQVTTKCCLDALHLNEVGSTAYHCALITMTDVVVQFCNAFRILLVDDGASQLRDDGSNSDPLLSPWSPPLPNAPLPPPANSIVLNKAASFLLGCFVGVASIDVCAERYTMRASVACLLASRPVVFPVAAATGRTMSGSMSRDIGLPPLGVSEGGCGCGSSNKGGDGSTHSTPCTHHRRGNSPVTSQRNPRSTPARCPTPPSVASPSSSGRQHHPSVSKRTSQDGTLCLEDSVCSLAGSIGRGGSHVAARVAHDSARRALPSSSDDDNPNITGRPAGSAPLPPLVPILFQHPPLTADDAQDSLPIYRCDVGGFTLLFNRMLDELKTEEYLEGRTGMTPRRRCDSSYLGAARSGSGGVSPASSAGIGEAVTTPTPAPTSPRRPVYAQRYRNVEEEDMWLLQGLQGNRGAQQRVDSSFDMPFRSGSASAEAAAAMMPSTFLAQSWLLFDPNETPEGHLLAQEYHVDCPTTTVRTVDEDGAHGGIRRRGGASNSPSSGTVVGAWGTRLTTTGTWGDSSTEDDEEEDDQDDDAILPSVEDGATPPSFAMLNTTQPSSTTADDDMDALHSPTPRPGFKPPVATVAVPAAEGAAPVGKLFEPPQQQHPGLSPVPPYASGGTSNIRQSTGRPNSSSSRLLDSAFVEPSSFRGDVSTSELSSSTPNHPTTVVLPGSGEFAPRPSSASGRFPPGDDSPRN